MAEWFRFKDKMPEADRSVMVCICDKSSKKRVAQSINRLNEYQLNIYKTYEDKTHEYWWRYIIDTDFPPKSIEVGDVLVHKYYPSMSITILAKHDKDYFVLNSTPEYEVTSIFREKPMLEIYKRKE